MEEQKEKPKNTVLRSKNGKVEISITDKKIEFKAEKINLTHP